MGGQITVMEGFKAQGQRSYGSRCIFIELTWANAKWAYALYASFSVHLSVLACGTYTVHQRYGTELPCGPLKHFKWMLAHLMDEARGLILRFMLRTGEFTSRSSCFIREFTALYFLFSFWEHLPVTGRFTVKLDHINVLTVRPASLPAQNDVVTCRCTRALSITRVTCVRKDLLARNTSDITSTDFIPR